MTIKFHKGHAELAAFDAADAVWQTELDAAFGNGAGDARYQHHGRGNEGTALRAAYEAREAARIAWEGAR